MTQTQHLTPKMLLKEHFGYDQFREGQKPLIEAALLGRDHLAIMPTGGGKSLCYQLPALLLEGLTIVISPLIALMEDQVRTLNERGISATFINSSLTPEAIYTRIKAIQNQEYHLLYLAPESLQSRWIGQLFLSSPNNRRPNIPLIAIDEAHCIVQWGHDFRPAYLSLPHFIHHLKRMGQNPTIGAYTATATPKMREEIKRLLNLNTPLEVVTGFDRSNLYYRVIKSRDKKGALLRFLANQARGQAGIIYCLTRKEVEELTVELSAKGYRCRRYHAGLSSEERSSNQHDFLDGKIDIMIATNAFGMGIDKADVRFVLHYSLPHTLEAYYQEAGRAGRDGAPATALLLFDQRDLQKVRYFIELEQDSERRAIRYKSLYALLAYAASDRCLRQKIIHHFSDKKSEIPCHYCGNCDHQETLIDGTYRARVLLSTIHHLSHNAPLKTILAVVQGKKWAANSPFYSKISTFKQLANASALDLTTLLFSLHADGMISFSPDSRRAISLTKACRPLLRGEAPFLYRPPSALPQKGIAKKREKVEGYDPLLFEHLKALRSEIAEQESISPHHIFHDQTLRLFALHQPKSEAELEKISGVGPYKERRYAPRFIEEICSYLRLN